jgi:hypothetical protein
MALAFMHHQNLFDLAGAASFLGISFGEFAQLVRAGSDLPACTDAHDLFAIRFTRPALELWRLEHSFSCPRA